MKTVQGLTDVMLRYPNVQAGYYVHKHCFNANINQWLRSPFPICTQNFVAEFQSLQTRFVASYHGLYDESDVMRCRFARDL